MQITVVSDLRGLVQQQKKRQENHTVGGTKNVKEGKRERAERPTQQKKLINKVNFTQCSFPSTKKKKKRPEH